MGMQDMRDELEQLAFRHINPEAYDTVTRRLEELSDKNSGLIKKIEDELGALFAEKGLEATVKGRQKKAYSVFRKMQSKSLSFEQLSDVYGFRIIVPDVDACYRALGIVHTRWSVVPGRFKDYISTPKQNDYRSIHTTIIGPSRQRVELQIRTKRMHDIAEYGVAAHALYKDGIKSGNGELLSRDSNAYTWLRRTIESLSEGDNPEEFLEHTKLELFQDQVFCFTPKGKLIALPRSANAIDFAYAVHTDVGNTAVGAKINGKIAPLVSELINGDEVEILTSKAQAAPPAAWESLAKTGKARAAIRRATRVAVRAQYAGLGRRIVERLCQRAKIAYSDEKLTGALPRLARHSLDEVFSAVGRGEMRAADVARAMHPDYKEERAAAIKQQQKLERGWFGFTRTKAVKYQAPGGDGAIPIRGINGDLPVRFAPNGGAVPGDRIVGILTPGEGITIYPIQSPSLKDFEDVPERWIDLRWDTEERAPQRFPARITLKTVNEPGSLAQVAQVIAEHDGNIDNIHMERPSPDFTTVTIDLEVYDVKHLTSIIAQLRAKDVVAAAERVNA
jgi:RelA/SpoT family (p)ppGpp synthetase